MRTIYIQRKMLRHKLVQASIVDWEEKMIESRNRWFLAAFESWNKGSGNSDALDHTKTDLLLDARKCKQSVIDEVVQIAVADGIKVERIGNLIHFHDPFTYNILINHPDYSTHRLKFSDSTIMQCLKKIE